MAGSFSLPTIFANHMVLQRRKPTRVWGTGPEGETVEGKLHGHTATATVKGGRWELRFPSMEAAMGCTLALRCGDERVTLRDIAIGEVWVAGGQSNMQFPLRYDTDAVAFFPCSDMDIRFFIVPRASYAGQERDEDFSAWGKWRHCGSMAEMDFSAVAYYCALKLGKALSVPIGIVECNYGGTSVLAWMDGGALCGDAALGHYIDEYEAALRGLNLVQYNRDFAAKRQAMQRASFKAGMESYLRGEADAAGLKAFVAAHADVLRPLPMGPRDANRPGGLFQTMACAIAGYTCNGVLWYQGEADAVRAGQYAALFTHMIEHWRAAWQQALPFVFVQLAPFERDIGDSGEHYPELRRQQQMVADSVAGTHMVSIMDTGEQYNIHPPQKRPVGERLAATVLGAVYRLPVPYKAPRMQVVEQTPDGLTVHFANCTGGLVCRGAEVNGLELFCGEAAVEGYAATLDGLRLRITTVAPVTQLRFAWKGYVQVNLYNRDGFPALPFRWLRQAE